MPGSSGRMLVIPFPEPYPLQHRLQFLNIIISIPCKYYLCYCVRPWYWSFQGRSFWYENFHIPDCLWKVVFCTSNFLPKTLHDLLYFPVSVPPIFFMFYSLNLLILHTFLNWYIIFHWGISLFSWYKQDNGWKMLKKCSYRMEVEIVEKLMGW